MWVFFRWIMAFGSLGMKTAKCIMGVELVGGKWRSIIMIGFYHVITQKIRKVAPTNVISNKRSSVLIIFNVESLLIS